LINDVRARTSLARARITVSARSESLVTVTWIHEGAFHLFADYDRRVLTDHPPGLVRHFFTSAMPPGCESLRRHQKLEGGEGIGLEMSP
jgi:hypothetical protein